MSPACGTEVRRARIGVAPFLLLQAIVVSAAAGGAVLSWRNVKVDADLPAMQQHPRKVRPLYDYAVVVSDEQLRRVLARLRPRKEGTSTKINHVDHALRFWTADAQFGDAGLLSGRAMQELLTDQRAFAAVYGNAQPGLLIDAHDGVRVRVNEGDASSSHVDHTTACLAEVGTPLDYPVVTPGRRTTYQAMVEQSLRDFSLNQDEYEWSVLTYALFVPPVRQWRTTEGQQISFDLLARRIMREDLREGVCFANHRLYTLAVLLRIDERTPILSADMRSQVADFLRMVTRLMVAHQHADGFWNDRWSYAAPSSTSPTKREGDRLGDRVLATGHALEWWAIAPVELHPPRHVLASAGQWLVRTVDQLSDQEVQANYTFLSHAGRALALWRKTTPPDALGDIRSTLSRGR